MSQNGKRRASSEELQEPSSKRQRLGELQHAATEANIVDQANITGHPTNASYGTIGDQVTTTVQTNIPQGPRDRTAGDAGHIVGEAVHNNSETRGVDQTISTAAKGKRRASSPAPEEPNPKHSVRGQRRAELKEAGLNDKERGTVQEKNGQMYCMHPVDKTWVPAVFHSAIRAELIAAASARGSYSVERASGSLDNDETSYLESQRDWSGERQHWHRIRRNVLNRHERDGWRDDYHGQRAEIWIHHDGRMVIDHDRNPMYRHPSLPDTLSSAIEGWYLEAVMRLDRRIQRETIRARLPDARRPRNSKAESKGMFALTAISNKRMRFRRNEGLVAWDSRTASTELNNYFRSFIPQASLDRNSNEGGRSLYKAERDHADNIKKGKEVGTSSSSTTTPKQATAVALVITESGGLTRAGNLASPSPFAQNNGQRLHRRRQAGQAFDPNALSFLPDEGFNPYQSRPHEPTQSAVTQRNPGWYNNAMGPPPPPPPQFDGTTFTGGPSSNYHDVEDQLSRRPLRFSEPAHPERSRNGVGEGNVKSTQRQTKHRAAGAGSGRRGRAPWRNNDPPIAQGTSTTYNGSKPAGEGSNKLQVPSGSSGLLDHTQGTRSSAGYRNGEGDRPSGQPEDSVRTESWGGSTIAAGIIPQSNGSNGNRGNGDFIQQPVLSQQEAPFTGTSHPTVEDDQDPLFGDNPFAPEYAWPTELEIEELNRPELLNANFDPQSLGARLENTPPDTAGPSSTRQVRYDNFAPLQDGQQNSVWRLDDNGAWVLDEEAGETARGQVVDASNNTADTNGNHLAAPRTSPQLYQTGGTAINMGDTLFPTASTAPHPVQPTASPTAMDQSILPENDNIQQAAPSHSASSRSTNVPSPTPTDNDVPAENIDPAFAIPMNHFQFATIQTLLEPTRRAFLAAFQDDSWRSYVPRDYVPPTDRSLSCQLAYEQLSLDFWGIWTTRYGMNAEVPTLTPPSFIDEFAAIVLRGLPGP